MSSAEDVLMYQDYILRASNICKEFQQGKTSLKVLKNLSLRVKKRDSICIVGPSGAGKSTFLHILGTLDRATSGQIFFKDQDLTLADEKTKAIFRSQHVGFVFQSHYLLNEFTALENLVIAGQIGEQSQKDSKDKAQHLLEMMKLTDRIKHFPSELSGGEQQRVAIARSLMNDPDILLVDEPTGNLDTKNSTHVLDILLDLRQKLGLTLIAVSHDSYFSKSFPKILEMRDGKWMDS